MSNFDAFDYRPQMYDLNRSRLEGVKGKTSLGQMKLDRGGSTDSYFFNLVTIGQGKSRQRGVRSIAAVNPTNAQISKAFAGLERYSCGMINLRQDSSTGCNSTSSVLRPEDSAFQVQSHQMNEFGSDSGSVVQPLQTLQEQSQGKGKWESEDDEIVIVGKSSSFVGYCRSGSPNVMVAPRLHSLTSKRTGLAPQESPGRESRTARLSSSFTFGSNSSTVEQQAAVSVSSINFDNEYQPRRSSSAFRRMSRSSSTGNTYRQSLEYGVLLGDKWVNGVGGTGTPQSHGSVSRGSSFGGGQNTTGGSENEEGGQRVMSTREKLQNGQGNDFMTMDGDPAEKMKQQLEALFVNHPEIANRIHDGVCDVNNKDGYASHTRQLHLHWDVTGALCINQYIMIKKIAEGAHGKVKLCYNTVDKTMYAIKVLYRKNLNQQLNKRHSLRKNRKLQVVQDKAMNDVLREIAVLKKLEHPNVVKLKEVIDPPDDENPLMLVMDYLEGGHVVNRIPGTEDLFEVVSEEEAREYFRMMCKGLDYLHYNCVVHGDLKPENLLLDGKGELKIADFGCARIKDVKTLDSATSHYGTPAFRAPEMLSGETYDAFAADIWALGVCLYCMTVGTLPFRGSIIEMYDNIRYQKLTFPEDADIDPQLKDLLTRILHKDPMRRALLFDIMSHPWVTETGSYRLVPILEQTRPPNRVQVNEKEQFGAVAEDEYLLKPQFKEVSFNDGDYLIRSGDTSSVLYFILSGAVEVKDPNGLGGNKQRISLNLTPCDALAFQGAPEDSSMQEHLHLDSQQTEEVIQRIHESTKDRYKEVLLEVKGPTNIIGDISICHPVRPYPFNAVARGNVVALELTQDMLHDFLSHIYKQDFQYMYKEDQAPPPTTPSSSRSRQNTVPKRNVSFSANA